MLQALKKVAGAVALAAFMVLGCMTAFADDEVQNPPSPHVVYQVLQNLIEKHKEEGNEKHGQTRAGNLPA